MTKRTSQNAFHASLVTYFVSEICGKRVAHFCTNSNNHRHIQARIHCALRRHIQYSYIYHIFSSHDATYTSTSTYIYIQNIHTSYCWNFNFLDDCSSFSAKLTEKFIIYCRVLIKYIFLQFITRYKIYCKLTKHFINNILSRISLFFLFTQNVCLFPQNFGKIILLADTQTVLSHHTTKNTNGHAQPRKNWKKIRPHLKINCSLLATL